MMTDCRFALCQGHFVVGATLLDAELQRRIERALIAAEDTQLDFTAAHTHKTTQH